jgi:hypothetical protein
MNLDALTSATKLKETKSQNIPQLTLLMARINLYAFCLKHATKSKTSEATQILLSAFNCATSVAQIFTKSPPLSTASVDNVARVGFPAETFYPRNYWYGFVYALLILMKLSKMETLPGLEIQQGEATIQQALSLMTSCSMVPGDEHSRVLRLIGRLRQEAAQELIQSQHSIHSRMGASLMYKLIFSAIMWDNRKIKEELMRNGPVKGKLSKPFDYLIEGWVPNVLDMDDWAMLMDDQA